MPNCFVCGSPLKPARRELLQYAELGVAALVFLALLVARLL